MSTEVALRSAASMAEKIEYCKLMSDSGLLPDSYRRQPANVLYAVEYGETLGISAMAAINGVHVIKGKPTASAGLISALVRRAGHKLRVGYIAATMTGWAEIVRSDDPGYTFRSEWDLRRAELADLCKVQNGMPVAVSSKGEILPWQKFFPSMVKARAITEVSRDACEEVLFGLHYTPEELGAQVDEDGMPFVVQAAAEFATPPQQPVDRRDQVVASAGQHRPQMTRTHTSAPVADQWSTPAPAAEPIADAEIVPEEPAQPAESTQDQHIAIGALFARKYGLTRREHKLAVISQTAGPIGSTKDLSWHQARGCIGWLEQMDDWAPGEPEQAAIEQFKADIRAAAHMEALERVGKRINAIRADGPLSEVGLCHVRLAWMDRRAELPKPEPVVEAEQVPADAEMAGV